MGCDSETVHNDKCPGQARASWFSIGLADFQVFCVDFNLKKGGFLE